MDKEARANENGAEIAIEIRGRLSNESNIHTIDDIDNPTSEDEIKVVENMDNCVNALHDQGIDLSDEENSKGGSHPKGRNARAKSLEIDRGCAR